MSEIEAILGLLVAVVALAPVARWLGWPYPVAMVLGGLAFAAIPGLPIVTVEPDTVFLLFVAPLVFATAWLSSLRDIRANVRPIGLLAFGLLIVTMVGVAVVAHASIAGLTWPSAFVLGTLVAPTDTVAVAAIAEQVRLPRRLITVLEGEGLLDDATGLVAYRMAVGVVLSGSFSVWEAGYELVMVTAGGVAVGLIVGWLVTRIWAYLDDPPVEITFSILAPFAAYLPAEALGVSGVVAVAVTGLYTGWRSPGLLSADTRIKTAAVWDVLTFLLNGLIFVLVGFQLRSLSTVLSERPAASVIIAAALLCLVIIVLRFAWVFPSTYLPRRLSRTLRERDPSPSWRYVAVLGWTGMRGGDSMAAALAIPFVGAGGAPFPARDLIIALVFCVILVTLVSQGLSLPLLIRRLGVREDPSGDRELEQAQLAATRAALERLDDLEDESWAAPPLIEELRSEYDHLVGHYTNEADAADEAQHAVERRLQRELIEAARLAVIDLRNKGVIGDEALRHVQRDLDLDELGLDQEDQAAAWAADDAKTD
jgi:CPA1 family monovalent cation:H+ antiporter